MRAALFRGPGQLRLVDVPRPVPAAGQTLVQVEIALMLSSGFSAIVDGRRVVGFDGESDGFAEWLVVAGDSLLDVPRTLAPEVAALVSPLARCLARVERAEIAAGDVVAIRGGGIGPLLLAACVADAGGWPVVEGSDLAAEFGAHPGDGPFAAELAPDDGLTAHTPATVGAALGFLASGAYPWERLITHRVLFDDLPALVADPPTGLLEAAVVM